MKRFPYFPHTFFYSHIYLLALPFLQSQQVYAYDISTTSQHYVLFSQWCSKQLTLDFHFLLMTCQRMLYIYYPLMCFTVFLFKLTIVNICDVFLLFIYPFHKQERLAQVTGCNCLKPPPGVSIMHYIQTLLFLWTKFYQFNIFTHFKLTYTHFSHTE